MVRSRGVRTFTSKPNDQCSQSVVAVFEVMRLLVLVHTLIEIGLIIVFM
jgi:hypothetical protein